MITYTEEKNFTKEQVQNLFLSVNWESGNYPNHLYQALINSSSVITAWDHDQLVGLCRVIDDTCMLAQIHYVLVRPDHRHQGIATHMLDLIKDKYKDFLYLEVMPEDRKNLSFYKKHGFTLMEKGCAMQIVNQDFNDER